MNIITSSGFIIGILVGLIIVAIVLKFVNKDHKAKSEYDERQRIIRGRGYMYAFYTIGIAEVILASLSLAEIDLPMEGIAIHMIPFFAGCITLGCYCVWKGAYWGLNNNPMRYMIVFVLTAIINLLPVIAALRSGTLVEEGRITFPFINLLAFIMILAILIALGLRVLADRITDGED